MSDRAPSKCPLRSRMLRNIHEQKRTFLDPCRWRARRPLASRVDCGMKRSEMLFGKYELNPLEITGAARLQNTLAAKYRNRSDFSLGGGTID